MPRTLSNVRTPPEFGGYFVAQFAAVLSAKPEPSDTSSETLPASDRPAVAMLEPTSKPCPKKHVLRRLAMRWDLEFLLAVAPVTNENRAGVRRRHPPTDRGPLGTRIRRPNRSLGNSPGHCISAGVFQQANCSRNIPGLTVFQGSMWPGTFLPGTASHVLSVVRTSQPAYKERPRKRVCRQRMLAANRGARQLGSLKLQKF